MKRTLNENVTIDVAMLLQVYPDISIDMIASKLQDEGADIDPDQDVRETGELEVYDMTSDEVIDCLAPMISDIADFISGELNENRDYPSYESVIITPRRKNRKRRLNEFTEFDPEDELNDCSGANCEEFDECDTFDECGIYNEDEDFDECETYESRRPLRNRRRLNERRKGCCPPKRKATRRIPLSEALRRARRSTRLNESIINNAIKKASAERKLEEKRNPKDAKLAQIKKELGAAKYNFIVESLKAKKTHLYENKKINGKNISEYSSKELYNILKTVNEQKKKLEERLQSLNESLSLNEKREINEKIEKKTRLFNILDEELTYRLTLKKLIKESDENPLEPLPMGPEVGQDEPKDEESKDEESKDEEPKDGEGDEEPKDDENPEEFEEVTLSSVVITLDSEEAAQDLVNSCVEAGIPEDAIEIKSDEPEEGKDEEPAEGEGDEEPAEGDEGEKAEGDEGEQPNESMHYNRFKKLLEADGDEDTEESKDGEGEGDEEPAEGDDEPKEGDDEPKQFQVVLTNTDYVETLGDVLQDVYGIEPEEFQEMIGGEIVKDDDEESKDEEPAEGEGDEESKDEEGSKGDEAVDGLSDDDLKDLFGGE